MALIREQSPTNPQAELSFDDRLKNVEMADYRAKAEHCSALKDFVNSNYPDSKYASATQQLQQVAELNMNNGVATNEPIAENTIENIPEAEKALADQFLDNVRTKATKAELDPAAATDLANITAESLGCCSATKDYLQAEIQNIFFGSTNQDNSQIS